MHDIADYARIGGLSRVANLTQEQIREGTTRAREGLTRKLEREADPDGVLDPEELARRVAILRRLHMERMGLASVKARRERRAAEAAAREAAELDALIDGGAA